MMQFRLIPLETRSAAMHMALDEACLEAVAAKKAPPTIRLYRWSPSAVTIGNFQCLHDEVDLDACREQGVDVVRRLTGGGAVYHDSEGEVTYSIIGPLAAFPKDVITSYKEICGCVVAALEEIGVKAEFRPINDIVVDGRKVSGSAQTRRSGVLVQHGTILLTVDPNRMFALLTPDKAKLSDKPFIKSVKASVTSLFEYAPDVSRDDIEIAIANALSAEYGATVGEWTDWELGRAEHLAAEKYGSERWNEMR